MKTNKIFWIFHVILYFNFLPLDLKCVGTTNVTQQKNYWLTKYFYKEIRIKFLEGEERTFRIMDLKNFKYLEELLNENERNLEFSDVFADHFEKIIALRGSGLNANMLTLKYFSDTKFVELYKTLTQNYTNHIQELFSEITKIVKKIYAEYPVLDNIINLPEQSSENRDTDFQMFISAAPFSPIVLEFYRVWWYIKYSYVDEIDPVTKFSRVESIYFEVLTFYEYEHSLGISYGDALFLFRIMEILHLKSNGAPINITIYPIFGTSVTFSKFFFDFLNVANKENRIFININLLKPQYKNELKKVSALRFIVYRTPETELMPIENTAFKFRPSYAALVS